MKISLFSPSIHDDDPKILEDGNNDDCAFSLLMRQTLGKEH